MPFAEARRDSDRNYVLAKSLSVDTKALLTERLAHAGVLWILGHGTD